MSGKKRIFYGWAIVAASAATLAMGHGMLTNTNSVFVKPVCESLGFARGEFTLYRTVITLVGAFLMPVYGRLIQRRGVKAAMLLSAVMLSFSAFGYSLATKLWHFYAVAVVNGLFVNGVSVMSAGVLVNAWFRGKKGLASGLAFGGSGVGGAMMTPIVGRVIELWGWRASYRLMGVAGLATLLPIILLLVKNDPGDMGLEPLPETEKRPGSKLRPSTELSFREAARTGIFWMLLCAFVFISLFFAATNTHSAPYLSDLGYPVAFVSAVISLYLLCLTVGKIILGLAYDRLGTLAGSAVVAFFGMGFPIFALLARNPAMAWVYAVFIGIASCGVSVPSSVLTSRYFGQKEFPAIFSFYNMMASFAQSVSVPVMGTVYDFTGSYRPAFIAFLFFSGIVTVCLIGAETVHRRRAEAAAGAR